MRMQHQVLHKELVDLRLVALDGEACSAHMDLLEEQDLALSWVHLVLQDLLEMSTLIVATTKS